MGKSRNVADPYMSDKDLHDAFRNEDHHDFLYDMPCESDDDSMQHEIEFTYIPQTEATFIHYFFIRNGYVWHMNQ